MIGAAALPALAQALLQAIASGTSNPFAALSLIGAPAILTNSCAVLAMSTGNRLARAVDLGRTAAQALEHTASAEASEGDADTAQRLRELEAANARSILLLRALRAIYAAMGGFATATFLSLVGVVFVQAFATTAIHAVEVLALGAGFVGVGAIVWAATLLTRETRIAVMALNERLATQEARFAKR